MEINVKEINTYSREMSVQVSWAELEEGFNKHAKKFSKKVNLPGFRPGKVPMKVLMKQFKPAMEADFCGGCLEFILFTSAQGKRPFTCE